MNYFMLRRFSYLDKDRMARITAQAIKKHNAKGSAKKVFGREEIGKDWMKKEVRTVIEYLSKRNVFNSRFDSRKNLENFFESVSNAVILNKLESKKKEAVQREVVIYIGQLLSERRPKDLHQFLDSFRVTVDTVYERVNVFNETIKSMNYSGRPVKTKEEADAKYNRGNAFDAFGHASAKIDVIPEFKPYVMDAINHLEEMLNKHHTRK